MKWWKLRDCRHRGVDGGVTEQQGGYLAPCAAHRLRVLSDAIHRLHEDRDTHRCYLPGTLMPKPRMVALRLICQLNAFLMCLLYALGTHAGGDTILRLLRNSTYEAALL